MAATRPNKLPTNLKERIAALEQRTTNSTASSPPTSPSQSAAPTVAHNGPPAGALKDKIAKFERKGGVPVPRGSFGLGAPPATEGPKRQGELYGNRIQTLTPQYTGGSLMSIGSFVNSAQRRSFSASVLTGNFDDSYLDYTPIPSPTFTTPLGSPDSTSDSPEASPPPSMHGDIPVVRRNATRGTSFHEALEFARKVEAAKKKASMPSMKKKSTDDNDETIEKPPGEEAKELFAPAPVILVSVDDLTHEFANPVVGGPPQQSSGKTDLLVEPLPSEPEVKPPVVNLEEPMVDGPETNQDSDLEKETLIVSDNRIAPITKAESNIDNGTSAEATPVLALPSTSLPVTQVAELDQMSRVEVHSSGQRKRGRDNGIDNGSKLDEPSSTSKQTPPIILEDAQSNLILTGSLDVELLRKDGKDLFVDKEAPVTSTVGPKDNTSSESNNLVAIEVSAPMTVDVDEPPLRIRSQIPVPRVKPTIQPPDSSSFLSPPSSSFRLDQVSSGASLSSTSSASSRPLSMVETSPGEVSRALKMTPATGRGIPVFLPPTNLQPRKSDFVYFPLSPEDHPNIDASLKSSLVQHKAGSESDLTSNTFKAVVHGKVKDTPASATIPTRTMVIPQTPMKDIKRATILQSPLSPGHGELAALLQEAMLLEDTLNKGELPGEAPKDESVGSGVDANSKSRDAARLKEEKQRIASATAQLRSKRDMPTHGRLKHTFLMPLSKARATQKQEVLTPAEPAAPRSSREESRSKGTVFDHAAGKNVIAESPSSAPSSPSKIPKLSKFPSFKRFGSISRTVTQQEALLRHNNSISSEISSTDSNLIVTPPDNAPMEFGERRSTTKDVDQQSAHSQTLSFSFPSLSPKKSASLGRAASFAEKMWARARTKSNGSVLSLSGGKDRSTEELTPQLPVLSELPAIPNLSSIVPPQTEKDSALHRPASSSSLRNQVDISGPSTAPLVPSFPTYTLPHPQSKTPVSKDVPLLPESYFANQPFSPMSVSSIGSLPSPLFDKDICDAFPAVPTDTPAQLPDRYLSHGRGQGLTAAATGDFDSALLSSAIHLAARNKASS